MDAKTQEKIGNLQLLENRIQNNVIQKQQISSQLAEIENALKELNNDPKETYKIIANMMVETDKDSLIKDLNQKKEILDLKLKTVEKQENKLKEEAESLQKEVMEKVKNEPGN